MGYNTATTKHLRNVFGWTATSNDDDDEDDHSNNEVWPGGLSWEWEEVSYRLEARF